MLRASSVGLGLPSRTINTGPICRRIHACWQKYHYCFPANPDLTGRTSLLAHRFYSHKANLDAGSGGKLRTENAPTSLSRGQSPSGVVDASRTLADSSQAQSVGTQLASLGSLPEDAEEEMREFMLEEDIQILKAQDGRPAQRPAADIPAFASGRPWAKEIKRIFYSDLDKVLLRIWNDVHQEVEGNSTLPQTTGEGKTHAQPRFPLLHVTLREHLIDLSQTQSVEAAWHSYTALVKCITHIPGVHRHLPHIPFAHLHRLCRLLASNRPKTHQQYLRLLAVMTYLRHCGGKIHQYEYNALVDHAGKGWRKTREEELQHAKRVAEDVAQGRLPGLTEEAYEFQNEDYVGLSPDIYTYTTLISTAARALNTKEILNLAAIMHRTGLPPNRITHLALLRYFTQRRNLGGVRSTLQKMRAQNLELGLDGLNACMWAYGRNNRLDVTLMVYRLLRHNVLPETYKGEGDVRATAAQLAEEYVFVDTAIGPNEVTFTMLIQMMAYLGHFQAVLDIFQDFLTFENRELGAAHPSSTGESKPPFYAPTPSIYRNIFLGFAKHGVPPTYIAQDNRASWNLDNLTDLFERFLHLPSDTKLSYANVDLLMKAFSVTSADNHELMRDVWIALEERFGPVEFRPNSANRLMRLKTKLFPEHSQEQSLQPHQEPLRV